MIIAYDFDGTIVENKFPAIGNPRKGCRYATVIDDLIALRKKGHKLILWTCREGEHLQQAVEFCRERGLEFDAINDDLEETKQEFADKLEIWKTSGRARKVFANYYVDDRAIGLLDENFLMGYCGLYE